MGANAPGRVANAVMRRRSMTAAEAALPSSISANGEPRSRRDRCSDGIDVLNGCRLRLAMLEVRVDQVADGAA